MSDADPIGDRILPTTAADGGRDGGLGPAQPLTQAEIDDVLSNPGMTIEEKRERLAAHTGLVDDRSDTDRGGEFEPLEMKLRDALSMLADGGHAYGATDRVDVDPEGVGDLHSPDHGAPDRR